MFKNGYQGGPYFEIFSTQGRDSTANWKLSSSGIKKIYEKEVKGYVLTLEGAPATTKLQAPKDAKQSLTLVQRFLVAQIYIPKGADFSMELGVTDLSNNKRRLVLSSAQKETQVTPLHAKVPLAVARRAIWTNLALDMVSLVGETWTSQTFRCVDQISISANCKLRRVFTMKSQPPDTTDDDELYGCSSTNSGELDNIPRQCQMAPDVPQITQVITLNKIKCAERLKVGKGPTLAEQIRPGSMLDLDLNGSGRKIQTSDGKIAFGSKAPKAPPDSGRRTARQGSVTTRSFRSQTSRIDAQTNGNGNNISTSDSVASSRDGILPSGSNSEVMDGFQRPRPPASANSVLSNNNSVISSQYNRQQSEPVTEEDYNYLNFNGNKEGPIVAPHPPRQPSNDRVRRRYRIKSFGQKEGVAKGDYSSPPTSAAVTASGHNAPDLSPGQGSGLPSRSRLNLRDSGVGPDVPEIQSPRKGENLSESPVYNEQDSLSEVISLLRAEKDSAAKWTRGNHGNSIAASNPNWRDGELGRREEGRRERPVERDSDDDDDDDGGGGWTRNEPSNDTTAEDPEDSSSASDDSNPGEYEESDEEASTGTNKLHLFVSPPKSAPRRNISPATTETDSTQAKKSFVKGFRSNIKKSTDTSSQRGARLEDDFVSHSSSDDEMAGNPHHYQHHHHHHHVGHHHHHHARSRRPVGGPAVPVSLRRNNNAHHHPASVSSSGYNSANYSSAPSSSSVKSQHVTRPGSENKSKHLAPKASMSPDQKMSSFDPSLYSDKGPTSLSRMNRRSLREITNPHVDNKLNSSQGSDKLQYDHTKYQMEDLTESFEARMFLSMRRQAEEALEDVSPPSTLARGSNLNASQTLRNSHHLNPSSSNIVHLYSESPATTSDDDTSFSTWKAPAQGQVPHNYQEEMKSRRSSDTLTSSNPRDWSGVISPPIGPLTQVQDLQGTMEGISDELSDEPLASHEKTRIPLTDENEEEKLDLYFDPKLNCYYDPNTKKWYEIVT